jgi:hypothetical protein
MKLTESLFFFAASCSPCLACQPLEKGNADIEGVLGNEKAVDLASFNKQINWNASSIILDVSDWVPDVSMQFNIESFVESVESDTATNLVANIGVAEGEYSATSDKHLVTIIGKGGRILVEDKEEAGLLFLESALEPSLDGLELLLRSVVMASGLGAIEEQMGQADIREVLAMSRPEEGSNEPDIGINNRIRASTKVFYWRTIGGLEVPSNRLVFTYSNSGELLRIRGRWVEVDYEASQMKSNISLENFVVKAKETLENSDVDIGNIQSDIVLRTYFKDVATENGEYLLDMVGGVFYRATGETGEPGMGIELEFNI